MNICVTCAHEAVRNHSIVHHTVLKKDLVFECFWMISLVVSKIFLHISLALNSLTNKSSSKLQVSCGNKRLGDHTFWETNQFTMESLLRLRCGGLCQKKYQSHQSFLCRMPAFFFLRTKKYIHPVTFQHFSNFSFTQFKQATRPLES